MINIEYDYSINKFTFSSSFDKEMLVDFIAIDLNTNLACAAWWTYFPPYGNGNFNLPTEYINDLSGVEVNAYYNKELIHTSKHQWKKLDNRFKFVAPKEELSFGSWYNLVCNDEYESQFSENDVIYDLGANFGVYTMWALYHNVKQVYAFEPTPKNVECLKETFKFDNNVTIFDKAIGAKDEQVTFYITPHSVGNSIYVTSGTPIEVECINLENFINQNNLLPPTIVKCDIEGSEYDFIESLTEDFFKTIHTFIIEFHHNDNNKVWNLIKKLLNLEYNIQVAKNNKIDSEMSTFIARK